jgi:hypothetical protein
MWITWNAIPWTLFAIIIMSLGAPTASAQRCPAGQDQFLNCLPMGGAARAKHEQWANQPAAYRIPGARQYGASAINISPVTGRPYNTETPVYCTRDRWLKGACK